MRLHGCRELNRKEQRVEEEQPVRGRGVPHTHSSPFLGRSQPELSQPFSSLPPLPGQLYLSLEGLLMSIFLALLGPQSLISRKADIPGTGTGRTWIL